VEPPVVRWTCVGTTSGAVELEQPLADCEEMLRHDHPDTKPSMSVAYKMSWVHTTTHFSSQATGDQTSGSDFSLHTEGIGP
jgi:hypothetical protein